MNTGCTCRKKHLHGASRSLVRRIGSSLPISTGRRLYIQLPSVESPRPEHGGFRYEATGQIYSSSSQGLTLASHMKDSQPNLLDSIAEERMADPGDVFYDKESEGLLLEEGEEDMMMLGGGEEHYRTSSQGSITSDEQKQDALHKISALEGELARLKAQIAVYALSESQCAAAPVPPPPPPPPPIMAQVGVGAHSSDGAATAADGGDVRKASQPTTQPVPRAAPRPPDHDFKTPARPSMSEMLKDIGSVKLRTVDAVRSPGGTPLRPKHHNQDVASNDPGAIIAQALRRKFAHQVFQDSPDKENLNRSDASLSGFDSPNVKLFN